MARKDYNSLTFRGAGAFFTALFFSSTCWRPTALILDPGKPLQVLRTHILTVLDAEVIAASCPKPLRVL